MLYLALVQLGGPDWASLKAGTCTSEQVLNLGITGSVVFSAHLVPRALRLALVAFGVLWATRKITGKSHAPLLRAQASLRQTHLLRYSTSRVPTI